MPSPPDVLGVPPDADRATIERAYRDRVKETHPDQGGSSRAFRRVKAAYEAMVEGEGDEPVTVADPPTTEPDRPDGTLVTYVDYEVVADYGWSLTDPTLFDQAAAEDLSVTDGGRFRTEPGESLLAGAERCGFTWPYSCRGGACANCAVKVLEGDLSQPVSHILTDELLDQGIRLSCVGEPMTEDLSVIFNVKHLSDVEELLLPPGPFERANPDF
jgi:curved DNA-binding protein CbpA